MHIVLVAAEEVRKLPMPHWVYPAIAFLTFMVLLTICLSFRGISNRHK